jgi:hypothetical protein
MSRRCSQRRWMPQCGDSKPASADSTSKPRPQTIERATGNGAKRVLFQVGGQHGEHLRPSWMGGGKVYHAAPRSCPLSPEPGIRGLCCLCWWRRVGINKCIVGRDSVIAILPASHIFLFGFQLQKSYEQDGKVSAAGRNVYSRGRDGVTETH